MAEKKIAKYPVIDYTPCVCCRMCDQACPVSAITLDQNGIDKWKNLYPRVNRIKCIGCGICAAQCSVEAITMVEA